MPEVDTAATGKSSNIVGNQAKLGLAKASDLIVATKTQPPFPLILPYVETTCPFAWSFLLRDLICSWAKLFCFMSVNDGVVYPFQLLRKLMHKILWAIKKLSLLILIGMHPFGRESFQRATQGLLSPCSLILVPTWTLQFGTKNNFPPVWGKRFFNHLGRKILFQIDKITTVTLNFRLRPHREWNWGFAT